MFIPNSAPATLAEMLEFLTPAVETGLFDSVAYDDADNPAHIHCSKDGNLLFRFAVNSGATWEIEPFIDSAMTALSARKFNSAKIDYLMRCAGGICFVSVTQSSQRQIFVIAKTKSGKTGSFKYGSSSNITASNYSTVLQISPTCFGDNSALKIFTSVYKIQTNYAEGSDRTILREIPVAGTYGSSDAFATAFIRDIVQHFSTGEQIIGGSHYGCMFHVALLDE